MGINNNPLPTGNSYSGSVIGANNNRWTDTNNNNYNRYNPSTGNTWYPNRDTGSSSNVNNNNGYSKSSPILYQSYCWLIECLMF